MIGFILLVGTLSVVSKGKIANLDSYAATIHLSLVVFLTLYLLIGFITFTCGKWK